MPISTNRQLWLSILQHVFHRLYVVPYYLDMKRVHEKTYEPEEAVPLANDGEPSFEFLHCILPLIKT